MSDWVFKNFSIAFIWSFISWELVPSLIALFIFLESSFSDLEYLKNRIRQLRLSLEQHVMMSGDSYAQKRISAAFSAKGAVMDAMEGIGMLRWVQDMDDHFQEKGQRLSEELEELAKKILTADRVALSITGDGGETDAQELLGFLREGQSAQQAVYPELGETFRGSLYVASRLLSYGYLWNDIRVQGGAYGTKLQVFPDGDILFTTYRDPNPARSLASFDGAARALREFCSLGEALDKSIISAIAASEPLLGAREKGKREAEYYLSGVNRDMRRKVRSEILCATPEDLLLIADLFDEICAKGSVCVIGGERVIREMTGYDRREIVESTNNLYFYIDTRGVRLWRKRKRYSLV